MASSSSSINAQLKYNVFLSFRGEDTRHNFTSHLHKALDEKKIITFIDDELNRGDEISLSLLNAIEQSQISVVIFSKRYASSRWCLQELVKIIECRETHGQIVIPVFYHVDPSHVRNQNGTFGDGFAKLEERFKDESHLKMLQMWRTALSTTANLSGCHLSENKSEAKLVEDIVYDILKKLNNIMPPVDSNNLVGVESSIKEIEQLLNLESKDVLSIGICGTGGIGKTTLARVVFNKILTQFQRYYFAENVREESEMPNGLIHLREKILSTLLGDAHPNTECSLIRGRLGLMKILIVLDDITSFQQIEKLIQDPKILGSGSRIIVTTRDKQVLNNFGVAQIYEVRELSHPKDLQLFSQYAFKLDFIPEDYMKLSKKVVNYAKGLPLALNVLGSSLHCKTKEQWKSAINKLKKTPPLDILKVLKVSYDGLDHDEKNIFLDIACFFKSEDKNLVIRFLDASDFAAEIGICVLEDKCLITISHNRIIMHDLLRDMGREIVREESMNDPGKNSRLWYHKDIYDVLTTNMGSKAIQGISLNNSEIEEIHLNPVAFSGMINLRFLKVYGSVYRQKDNKVHGFQDLEFDFSKLRYLYWDGYPSKSLPSNFHPCNLVALDMRCSNIKQMWTGVQNLVKLKYINLSNSMHLRLIPDLSKAQNLESLILSNCTSLSEIHSSIWYLSELQILDLSNCKSVINLPTSIRSKSLKEVSLFGCSNLQVVPKMSSTVEYLTLSKTPIQKIPSSMIKHLDNLVSLSLNNCLGIKSLPNGLCNLKFLKSLYLNGCSRLEMIPELPCNMDLLYLEGTAIGELPSSMEYLSHLRRLSLRNCSRLKYIPQNFSKLTSLDFLALDGCSKIEMIPEMPCKLSSLFTSGTAIKELPSLEYLSSLKLLNLRNCSRLENLPESFCKLESLQHLNLSGCRKLDIWSNDLRNLRKLRWLDVCGVLEKKLRLHVESPQRHVGQEMVAKFLRNISGLSALKSLDLSYQNIIELPDSLDQLSSLDMLNLAGNSFVSLPASIINLSKLWDLDLTNCNRLQFLPSLPGLPILEARGCRSLQALSEFQNLMKRKIERQICYKFVNCLQLEQDVLRDILMIFRAQAFLNTDKFSICIPGSEIPKWFDFQSSGSSIELPPVLLCSKMVACIVLAIQEYHYQDGSLTVDCDLHLKSKDGCYESDSFEHLRLMVCYVCRYSIESDNIILGVIQFVNSISNDGGAIINFRLGGKATKYYQVKKCGVYIVGDKPHLKSLEFLNFVEDESCTRILYAHETEKTKEESSRSSILHDDEREEEEEESHSRSSKLSNFCEGESSSSILNAHKKQKEEYGGLSFIPDDNDKEEEDEPYSKRLKSSNFFEAEPCSSLRQHCGASTTCDGQSSTLLWDVNKLVHDFARLVINVTSTTKQSVGDEPQPKRLKDVKRRREC